MPAVQPQLQAKLAGQDADLPTVSQGSVTAGENTNSAPAGAGTDEAYFEEAVLDFPDPQPDLGGLGTDAAYLAAGLTNIIDDRPVEDSTTKHFRPERKKHHGQSMGGM